MKDKVKCKRKKENKSEFLLLAKIKIGLNFLFDKNQKFVRKKQQISHQLVQVHPFVSTLHINALSSKHVHNLLFDSMSIFNTIYYPFCQNTLSPKSFHNLLFDCTSILS